MGASGLCHSDLHLINGEWKDVLPLKLPKTPGHEVAGWIEEIGESVPETAKMKEGDPSPYLVDGDVVFAYIAKEVMSRLL